MIFVLKAVDGDRAQLGGKAKALAELATGNFPIPDWVVLAPIAFEKSLTAAQQQQFEQGEISAALETLEIHPDVVSELQQAIAQLCGPSETLAVRSSAIAEDGMTHSFAGQFESFLSVYPQDVVENVLKVWKSAFSDRILTYCSEHHLPCPSAPAVLIQKMVNAEVAGVAFSANPVTGQRGVVVLSAIQGFADDLVSGESDGATYAVDRNGRILSRPTQTALNTLLRDDQVQAIAHLTRRAEAHFGRPQDIEWAIADNALYLLQSRPITTLANLPDPDGNLTIWDNSNIAESYGGITTPLTFSFAQRAYEAVYRQFCRLMGVSERAIAQHHPTFRCMIGLIQGRIYYNLLNWYRVLSLLPGFTVNRQFMEQMMGVREELPPEIVQAISSDQLNDKLKDGFRLAQTIFGLIKNYITLPQDIQRFYQRLEDALSLPVETLQTLRSDELVVYYTNLEQQLLTRWDAPLVNDFFAMIFYGVLRKLTLKWCGDTHETLQNDLISGEGGMISAEAAQRLREMAAIAAQKPNFMQTLRTSSLTQISQEMQQLPDFKAAYDRYLEQFGDRCMEELKLESETLHDNPLLLLRSVGSAWNREPSRQPEQTLSLREQAETTVERALQGQGLKRWVFGWVLQNARQRVRDRENLRFERTRVFGRVRRVFLEIGKRFYALNLLNTPRDIFYLNLDEILGTIDGTSTSTDLKGLVTLRQTEFQHYTQLSPPPNRFQTHSPTHPLRFHPSSFTPPSALPHSPSLQGTGCCPGVVRAPVQIITDPKTTQLQPGHILVAERTDPGWILLFPAAAGILVERGSLLSHAAIVSREMGIPAIVSIPQVTHFLKNGDYIEMNGSTGTVTRLEPTGESQHENPVIPHLDYSKGEPPFALTTRIVADSAE